MKLMKIEELTELVNDVVAQAGDAERAHSAEDHLMRLWIRLNAEPDELREFLRMWETDFPRWGA